MDNQFKGKVVVCTASSTGIGLAVMKKLADQGATVIINSRNQKNVNDAVGKIKSMGGDAYGIVVHAANPADRKKLFDFIKEKFGGLDILIPNAAVSTHFGMFMETPEKAMDKMYEVNYKAVHLLIQEFLPLMEGRKGANIVVMSSNTAYDPSNVIGFYSITKTMLVVMVKLMSKELLEKKIRVNAICPGIIKTNFSRSLYEDREQQVISDNNLPRLGVPQDVANLCSFIASSDADYISGESFLVAGKGSSRL